MPKPKMQAAVPALAIVPPLRLNLGAGRSKMEGFLSVDSVQFGGVDVVTDLRKRWPWEDCSVDEAHCSHFLEHLDAMERVHFFNELGRVLKVGAKCTIITPHWASNRAYGDPTHKWPPVAEMAYFYVLRSWRDANAPHTDARHVPGGFSCDLDASWGHSFDHQHVEILGRSDEHRNYAMRNFRDVAMDLIATVTKRADS